MIPFFLTESKSPHITSKETACKIRVCSMLKLEFRGFSLYVPLLWKMFIFSVNRDWLGKTLGLFNYVLLYHWCLTGFMN